MLFFAVLLLGAEVQGGGRAERHWPACTLESVRWEKDSLETLARLVPLEGAQLLRVGEFELLIDGERVTAEVDRRPFAEQPADSLSILLLLERSAATQAHFDSIALSVARWLRALPGGEIFLLTFGQTPGELVGPLSPIEAAAQVQRIPAGDDLEVGLISALHSLTGPLSSRRSAAPTRTPKRQIVVLIGSGLDRLSTPARFVAAGAELERAHLIVFPIAVASPKAAFQLLSLAELAWRTRGSFRWVREREETDLAPLLGAQLAAVQREIADTTLLSWKGAQLSAFLKPTKAGELHQVSLRCDGHASPSQPLSYPERERRSGPPPSLRIAIVVLTALLFAVSLSLTIRVFRQRA